MVFSAVTVGFSVTVESPNGSPFSGPLEGHLGGAFRESLQGGADHDAGCGAVPTGSARLWRPWLVRPCRAAELRCVNFYVGNIKVDGNGGMGNLKLVMFNGSCSKIPIYDGNS